MYKNPLPKFRKPIPAPDPIICKKYPEPMYTDSEKLRILEAENKELRSWLTHAVADLEYIANNNNLKNCIGIFSIRSRVDNHYKWIFHDYVAKYINKGGVTNE